jgi:hypothetical protein
MVADKTTRDVTMMMYALYVIMILKAKYMKRSLMSHHNAPAQWLCNDCWDAFDEQSSDN